MDLIQTLTSQLGISEQQAQGGAGLIFKLAKEKLNGDDFGQIAQAVPNIDNMMGAAPSGGGGMGGLIGKLGGMLGGGGSQIGNLAALAGGFKSLNLDSGMISQFLPVISSFLQSKGGDGVGSILEKLMK